MGHAGLRFTILVLLFAGTRADAQSLTTGAIAGVVKDAKSGDPLAQVTVVAVSTAGVPQMAITEVDGTYKITELLPGTYVVTFYYDTLTRQHGGVEVGVDQTTAVYEKLEVAGPNVIYVDDDGGTQIVTDSTAHQIKIGRKELEELPQRRLPIRAGPSGLNDSYVGWAAAGTSRREDSCSSRR
jgi:hypothetical protein